MSKVSEAIYKFQSGEYGESQANEIARTFTGDEKAVRIIAYLFQMLHREARDKHAVSCPFMTRRE